MPQHPDGLRSVYAEGLSDEQIAGLDAIEKAQVIRDLVAQAVENAGLSMQLSDEEEVLVKAYREWKDSKKSISGVFHFRRRDGEFA
jgi:hypothetical protein